MNRIDRLLDRARDAAGEVAEPLPDEIVAERINAFVERATTGSSARLKKVEARIAKDYPRWWASSFGALPDGEREAWRLAFDRAVETGNTDELRDLDRDLRRRHSDYKPDLHRAADIDTVVGHIRWLKRKGRRG